MFLLDLIHIYSFIGYINIYNLKPLDLNQELKTFYLDFIYNKIYLILVFFLGS